MSGPEDDDRWPGAIVAIEGPRKIVSTQLRLLPTSPRILLLPALNEYMPATGTCSTAAAATGGGVGGALLGRFDAASYVGQVNAAIKTRHAAAQAFLSNHGGSGSTAADGNKRLVFLEGGAASAQALCLRALMQHETAGDGPAAKAMLDRLVRRGLAGLVEGGGKGREEKVPQQPQKKPQQEEVEEEEGAGKEEEEEEEEKGDCRSKPVVVCETGPDGGDCQDENVNKDKSESSDPCTRAMRAADALYRLTASLQMSTDLDLAMLRASFMSPNLSAQSETTPFLVPANAAAAAAAAAAVAAAAAAASTKDTTAMPLRQRNSVEQSPPSEGPRFSMVRYDRQQDTDDNADVEPDKEMPSVFGFEDLPASADSSSSSAAKSRDQKETANADDDCPSTPQQQFYRHRRQDSGTISPTSEAFSIQSDGTATTRSSDRAQYGRASVLDVRLSVRDKGQGHTATAVPVKALRCETASSRRRPCDEQDFGFGHETGVEPSSLLDTKTHHVESNNTTRRGRPVEKVDSSTTASKYRTTAEASTTVTTGKKKNSTKKNKQLVNGSAANTPVSMERVRSVRLQPVPGDRKRRYQQKQQQTKLSTMYIEDDGAASRDSDSDSDYDGDGGPREPDEFEPVFPRMEDLVLYLRSELTPEPLLESALHAMREEFIRKSGGCSSRSSSRASSSYRGGSSASSASVKSLETDDETVILSASEMSCFPEHESLDEEEAGCQKGKQQAQQQDHTMSEATTVEQRPHSSLDSAEDYDPFAYDNPVYGQKSDRAAAPAPVMTVLRPPTPVQTPPPPTPPPRSSSRKPPPRTSSNEPAEADSRAVQPPQSGSDSALPVSPATNDEKDSLRDRDSVIYEIPVEPQQPPITVQNSLRSILNQYQTMTATRTAGPASDGFRAEQLPDVPEQPQEEEDQGLWRPIFGARVSLQTMAAPPRVDEGSQHSHKYPHQNQHYYHHYHHQQQLKQILAIGVQGGVRRAYSGRVISQIEKFGTESTGATRCIRMDFRRLLANTMQAFTSQPLTSQTSENPFANPQLLATLMLPHLEASLSTNAADIRFLLLEFPAEHLPTIIAIQKLAGVNLVKIAQIVDSQSRGRLPVGIGPAPIWEDTESACGVSTISSSSSLSSISSSDSPISSTSSGWSSSPRNHRLSVRPFRSSSLNVKMTRVNYLLTSSASDRDISDFVAAVWSQHSATHERPQSAPEAHRGRRFNPNMGVGLPLTMTTTTTPSWWRQQQQREKTKQKKNGDRQSQRQQQEVASLSSSSASYKSKPGKASPQASPLSTTSKAPVSPGSLLSAGVLSNAIAMATTTEKQRQQLRNGYEAGNQAFSGHGSDDDYRADNRGKLQSSVGSTHSAENAAESRSLSSGKSRGVGNGRGRRRSHTFSGPAPSQHIAHMGAAQQTPTRNTTAGLARTLSYKSSGGASSSGSRVQTGTIGSTDWDSEDSLLPPLPAWMAMSAGRSTKSSIDASSMMTFNPAEDSDYDDEERRLMPMFGKKLPRPKLGTQKALRVLGMS